MRDTRSYVSQVRAQDSALWKHKPSLLGTLDIELTERCNNNCIHCYINQPANDLAAKEREQDTRRIQGILVEAAALGCLRVRFSGGEPLLRDDFETIYLFARRLGMKVLLFTNATLITPALADLFVRIPPLETIEISIYGMSRRSYEAVSRTPGSLAAARRGIDLLRVRNIPFVVKGALLPSNKAELTQFEAWARAISVISTPPSEAMFFYLRCRRDSDEKNALISRLRLSPAESVRMLSRDPGGYRAAMREFLSKFSAPPGDKLFSCGAGRGNGCVDAFGMLQPCMMLRHPDSVYDLRSGSLKDAFTRFFPAMRELRATHAGYLARCARCFLKSLCEQCPAQSWMEHGTMDTPVDYHCGVAHAQARWLGVLAANEQAWDVANWQERIAAM